MVLELVTSKSLDEPITLRKVDWFVMQDKIDEISEAGDKKVKKLVWDLMIMMDEGISKEDELAFRKMIIEGEKMRGE